MAILDDLKKVLEEKLCENTNTNECVNGGYYDFPHTRNYDSDLGFLIKKYKELNGSYCVLVQIYNIIKEKIQEITINQLQEWLDDGMLEQLLNEVALTNLNQRRWNVLYPPEGFQALDNSGLTDNTEKLQALIDDNYILYFPEGSYLFNNQVLSNGKDIDMLGVANKTRILAQQGTSIEYIFDFSNSNNVYMKNFLFIDNMVKLMPTYDSSGDGLNMYRNMVNKNYDIENVICQNGSKEIGYTNWDKMIVSKKPSNYTPYKNGEYARYPMDIVNFSGYNGLNIANIAFDDEGNITSTNESSAVGIIYGNNSSAPMILLDNRGDSHILQLVSAARIDITSAKKPGVCLDINQLGQIAIGCLCDFDEPVAKRLADLKIYNKRPNICMFDTNKNSFDIVLDSETNTLSMLFNGNAFLLLSYYNNKIINDSLVYNKELKIIDNNKKWNAKIYIDNNGITHYSYYNGDILIQDLILGANYNGNTGTRPILTSENVGFMFFDSDIGKPIWWNGSKWVDSTGNYI